MRESVTVLEESKRQRWSDLIVRVAERDEAAFEKLYSETNAFGFAFRMLNDRAEAEEVTIDVFESMGADRAILAGPRFRSHLADGNYPIRLWVASGISHSACPIWLALDEVQQAALAGVGPIR